MKKFDITLTLEEIMFLDLILKSKDLHTKDLKKVKNDLLNTFDGVMLNHS